MKSLLTEPDLVCLSHLRWNFVFQRPQHILSRLAQNRRVFFIEEPIVDNKEISLEIIHEAENIWVVRPHIPEQMLANSDKINSILLSKLFSQKDIKEYVLWFYTPMAHTWTQDLKPLATVYDCMDELSAFKNAPPELKINEAALFNRADLVFTGGVSLFEAKKNKHPQVFAFPSSIDKKHFGQARSKVECPPDQPHCDKQRLGFFGVIDERLDIELLGSVAEELSDWEIMMIGPVVKIDEEHLPKNPNITYLGMKDYKQLPLYLSGWDVAILPFALNESTRFISPTKTPEYMAAGCPVISTSIRDVVRPYGDNGLVAIRDTAEGFAEAARSFNKRSLDYYAWLERVDDFLLYNSWDKTVQGMTELINEAIAGKRKSPIRSTTKVTFQKQRMSAGAIVDV